MKTKTKKSTTKKNSISLSLPTLITAEDYHSFHQYKRILQQMNPRIHCMEVGFDEFLGEYVGIVYTGREPSNATINSLLKENNFELLD